MKLITCASYYGSGSSAITNILGEFDNIFYMGDFEFRFIQDPDGVSDLEHQIVENHNRHNSGYALKKFKKNIDFLSSTGKIKKYERFFNNKFKLISYNYIDKLSLFKYDSVWHQDVKDKGLIYYFLDRVYNKLLTHTVGLVNHKPEKMYTLLKKDFTYATHPSQEYFLNCTKEYIHELFSIANKDNKEFVMADQLVPPSNLDRYFRYFNNLKVFVVDRDPRDLYLLEKLYWNGSIIPCYDIKLFCQWFSYTREHRKNEDLNNSNRIFIQFENLIYNYEITLERIYKFVGIKEDHHIYKKKYFNPEISIKNTRLWEKHPQFGKDIKYIEENLKDYCYNI